MQILSVIVCYKISGNENQNSIAKSKKCDRIVVCDPNHNEESIMDGKLVLGINPYKEICTLHLAGKMIIDKVWISMMLQLIDYGNIWFSCYPTPFINTDVIKFRSL